MNEEDIIYIGSTAWVFRDQKKKHYVVFVQTSTHSISDSAYALNEDGLSIAKARCDYIDKTKGTNHVSK